MDKKAAAALGTLGTGAAATATTLAVQGDGEATFDSSTSLTSLP